MPDPESGGQKPPPPVDSRVFFRRIVVLGIVLIGLLILFPALANTEEPPSTDLDTLYLLLIFLIFLLFLSIIKKAPAAPQVPPTAPATVPPSPPLLPPSPPPQIPPKVPAQPPKPPKTPKPPAKAKSKAKKKKAKKPKAKKKKAKGLPPLIGGGIGAGVGGAVTTPSSPSGYNFTPAFPPTVLYGTKIKLSTTLNRKGAPLDAAKVKHVFFKITNSSKHEVYTSPSLATRRGVVEMPDELHIRGTGFPEGEYGVYAWVEEPDVEIPEPDPTDPDTSPIGTFKVAKAEIRFDPSWSRGDPVHEIESGTAPTLTVAYPDNVPAALRPKFKFTMEDDGTKVPLRADEERVLEPTPAGMPEEIRLPRGRDFEDGHTYHFTVEPVDGDVCAEAETKFKLRKILHSIWTEFVPDKPEYTKGEEVALEATVKKDAGTSLEEIVESGNVKFTIVDDQSPPHEEEETKSIRPGMGVDDTAGYFATHVFETSHFKGACTITIEYLPAATEVSRRKRVSAAKLEFVEPSPDGSSEPEEDFKPRVNVTIPGRTEHDVYFFIGEPGIPDPDTIGDPVPTRGGDVDATDPIILAHIARGLPYTTYAILDGETTDGMQIFDDIQIETTITPKETLSAKFTAPTPVDLGLDLSVRRKRPKKIISRPKGDPVPVLAMLKPKIDSSKNTLTLKYRKLEGGNYTQLAHTVTENKVNEHLDISGEIDTANMDAEIYILELHVDNTVEARALFEVKEPTPYTATLRCKPPKPFKHVASGEEASVMLKISRKKAKADPDDIQEITLDISKEKIPIATFVERDPDVTTTRIERSDLSPDGNYTLRAEKKIFILATPENVATPKFAIKATLKTKTNEKLLTATTGANPSKGNKEREGHKRHKLVQKRIRGIPDSLVKSSKHILGKK